MEERRRKKMLITLDSRKRIALGKFLKGRSINLFNAELKNGKIILEPMKAVPEHEEWLYKNSEALDSVHRGLQDAADGKVKKLNLNSL